MNCILTFTIPTWKELDLCVQLVNCNYCVNVLFTWKISQNFAIWHCHSTIFSHRVSTSHKK